MPVNGAPVTLVGLISTVLVNRDECVNTAWDPDWQSLVDDGFMLVYDPPIACVNSRVLGDGQQTVAPAVSSYVDAAVAAATANTVRDAHFDIRQHLYNFEPDNFRKWSLALQKQAIGEDDARILCPGDSLTHGFGGVSAVWWQNSWPRRLADRLADVGAVQGLAIAQSIQGADSRYVPTGFASLSAPNVGWSPNDRRGYYVTTTNGSTLTFTPGVECDTFDVYTIIGGGNAAATIQATGGAVVNVPASATNPSAIVKYTATAASVSDTNSVTISCTGAFWVTGVEARRSDRKQILVANAGVGGSSATGWDDISGTVNFQQISQLKHVEAYAPDLSIVMLGTNDANLNVTVPNYVAAMQTIANSCALSGDVVFMTSPPSTLPAYTEISDYRDAVLGLGYPVIDLHGAIESVGGWAAYDAQGFVNADDLHGNSYSYSEWAGWVADALNLHP